MPNAVELVHHRARVENPAVSLETIFLTIRHHSLIPAAVGESLANMLPDLGT